MYDGVEVNKEEQALIENKIWWKELLERLN